MTLKGWEGILSLGEQQRLALTRILLAKPKLALLDECTSALDQGLEEMVYKMLIESKVTFVSVGHRHSLKRFHQRLLEFKRTPGARVDDACQVHMRDLPEKLER